MTGHDLADPQQQPTYVTEGTHYLTIYFESERSRQQYMDIPIKHPEQGVTNTMDNPTDDY